MIVLIYIGSLDRGQAGQVELSVYLPVYRGVRQHYISNLA
jgi:hypothetical protein